MPRFIVEARYEDDTELISFGHEFSLDDSQFNTQYLDLRDELFLAKDSLAEIKTITAAEDISDEVKTGDVVWRDWADCNVVTAEGRREAIALAVGTKALWRDRGFGYDMLGEFLCPSKEEIAYYGIGPEDEYLLPE